MAAQAFSIGAITELTRKTLDYAGKINDLSDRLSVSTDFLQEFSYVAKQNGTDLEKLTKIIESLNVARDKALSGGPESAKMLAQFKALGVSPAALKHSRIEDLITGPIADAFSKGDAQGKLGAAWKELGGKGAGELTASFVDGLKEGMEKARLAGNIMTNDQIQQLDAIGDQFAVLGDRLVVEWGGVMLTLIGWVRKLKNQIEQASAYYGAGSAQMSATDVALMIAAPGFHFGKNFDTKAAEKAADGVATDFDKELAAEVEARAKKRAARLKAQGVDISTVFDETPAAKKHKSDQLPNGDALTKVGNFLGSSQASLPRIAERTNQLLTSIDSNIKKMAITGGAVGGFPET